MASKQIVDFNVTDGLTPQQIEKLNYNFHLLASGASAQTQKAVETNQTALNASFNADSAKKSAVDAAQYAEDAWLSADDAASAAAESQRQAGISANAALASQGSAASSAEAASRSAEYAEESAGHAQESAAQAAQSARESARANTYANAALGQLGIVQDVIGVLDWASKHGGFVETEDTEVDDSKVYFTYDGTDFTPVVDPAENPAEASYWELDTSGEREAMNDFILSHLAVTSRGLWILPGGIGESEDEQHAPGYKMLLSNGGVYIYDSDGLLVRSDTGSGTDFSSYKSFHFGSNDAYILYTPASESTPASLVIGGTNVQLGSSKTLAEWEEEMQQAIDDAAEASQKVDDIPIVSVTSTNGTVFKRNVGVSTTLVANVFTPGGRISDAEELHRRFGAGAYLEWGWRDSATGAEHAIVSTDPRIGQGGFTFTVSPGDIDVQAVITCSLNY